MAAITYTPSLIYENGTLRRQFVPGTLAIPQANKGFISVTVTATTAEADLSVSTLGTPGLTIITNLEATTTGKTCNWGWKSSTGGIPQYSSCKPKHQHTVNYGTSSQTIRYKAASGTLQVEFVVFEA